MKFNVVFPRWVMNFPILNISQKTSKCGTNNAYTFLLLMCRWFVLTILMSSVVYYWTDTWQHGIYFLTRYKKYAKKKPAALVTELDFKWQGMLEKKTQLIPTATDHAYLSFTSNATIESAEWNNLLFGYHILQISVGLAYMQTLNGHSRLVCVLEVHTKIRTSRFTRLCWILWIGCVPSHLVLFYLP